VEQGAVIRAEVGFVHQAVNFIERKAERDVSVQEGGGRAIQDNLVRLRQAGGATEKRKRFTATLWYFRRFRIAVAVPSATASIHQCVSVASRSRGGSASR
jgi:hypothetical protein